MRVLLCFLLLFAACKRTAEGERGRYQAARDRLDAIATKNPAMKTDIQSKIAEFDKAFKAADGKSGDDQIAALAALNNRVASYEQVINPAQAAAPDASAASKLGSKLGPTPDAGGGKLGAPASASASKLAPAPAPAPASAPAPAPASAPTPAAAPASAPAAAPAKSGFGGAPDAPAAKSGFGGK
jgi:hypothetical protein